MCWKKASCFVFPAVVAICLSLGLASLERPGQAVAENATSAKEGEDGCCCSGHQGECCAVAGAKCSCGREVAMRNGPPRLELIAFAQPPQQDKEKPAAQDKEPAPQEKKVTSEAKALGSEIRKALLNHQRALKDAYNCCTNPGCVFCQSIGDSCPCGANLRKGEPVCPECWGGWQAGQGSIPAVKREEVKVFSKEALKALYEARAKTFKQALEGGPPEKK